MRSDCTTAVPVIGRDGGRYLDATTMVFARHGLRESVAAFPVWTYGRIQDFEVRVEGESEWLRIEGWQAEATRLRRDSCK